MLSYFHMRRIYRQLLEKGQILDGSLLEVEEKFNRLDRHYLIVMFKYQTPEGEDRKAIQRTYRQHQWMQLPLLLPHTPIKVLYADDSALTML